MERGARYLLEAFVAALPEVAERRRQRQGWERPPQWETALGEAQAWLAQELAELLATPHRQQTRSPLEIFQEAMRFPNEALAAAGADPPRRDPVAEGVLPGDAYDLAPASSQELGEEAWRAHLEWGAERARALRPAVLWIGGDLMDRSKIEPIVEEAGLSLLPTAAEHVAEELVAHNVVFALCDLRVPGVLDALRDLAEENVRSVAYGPHVDDEAMQRARLAGAGEAMPRSRFFNRLAELLPQRA